MYYYKYKTTLGDIFISANEEYLLSIAYVKRSDFIEKETALIKEAYLQIEEYLNGKRHNFNLPLLISGTKFQQQVYRSLMNLEYGETISYKGIAHEIKRDKAARAVGQACNRNPFAIVIPCHRVISSNNKLVGYAGGLDKKQKLLNLEGSKFIN